MRISQFLILPPFQNKGLGKRVYSELYSRFLADEKVADICVEDPNDSFQDMRDKCDVSRLMHMIISNTGPLRSPAQILSRDSIAQITKNYKLCTRQATRVAEIICLMKLPKYDFDGYKEYRLAIKQRLFRQNKEVLMEMEFGDRIAALQHTFNAVEEDYQAIIKALIK